jgi:hypothetical protein
MKAKYPESPIVVLSSLARGVEQLAARVAIQMGIPFIVVLSMPEKAYIKEWDAASIEEFYRLCDKAENIIRLSKSITAAYIAEHCRFIIAFWDGIPDENLPGPAQTVSFMKKGISPEYAINKQQSLASMDVGLVKHYVMPQGNQEEAADIDLIPVIIEPELWENNPAEQARFEQALQDGNEYNKRVCKQAKKQDEINGRRYYSIKKDFGALLPAENISAISHDSIKIADRFLFVDMQATRIQSERKYLMIGFIFVGLIIVLIQQIYSAIHWPWLAIAYSVAAILVAIAFYYLKIPAMHEKALNYRALAEGLRVQFYWHFSGLKNDVSDYYMKDFTTGSWIRYAIRSWNLFNKHVDGLDNQSKQQQKQWVYEIVANYWAHSQGVWYQNKSKYNLDQGNRWRRWGWRVFCSGLIFSLISGAGQWTGTNFQIVFDASDWYRWFDFIASITPGIVVALFAYIEKRTFPMLGNLYSYSSVAFLRTGNHLAKILKSPCDKHTEEGIVEIIECLGIRALSEQEEWIRIQRDHPIEAPK